MRMMYALVSPQEAADTGLDVSLYRKAKDGSIVVPADKAPDGARLYSRSELFNLLKD